MGDEPCYDLNELARSNWHVHTNRSGCALPEMTMGSIAAAAEAAGLRTVALVDHHNDPREDIVGLNGALKVELEEVDTPVRFVIGAELSATGIGKFADSTAVNRRVDYRLYSCNHYHLGHWEHPEERTPRAYAEHMLAVLWNLLPSGRADCIAHPLLASFIAIEGADHTAVTRAITDQEMADVFELCTLNSVAWDLNARCMLDDPEMSRRQWNVGREVGVAFRLGTDAHRLAEIATSPLLPKLMQMLS